jgi:hypothetical protein
MRPLRQSGPPIPELEPVESWRSMRLREAGVSPQLADTLAQDSAYDLHDVLRLLDRGCPPELAARILAPIEHQPRSC